MLQIIIKETKDFLRDKSNAFFFLIFPVLLVFLLGSLLSGLDKAEETIGEIRIHYMVETEALMDILAIEGFIEGVSDEQNILFVKTEDMKTSKEMIGEGEIAAAIVFTNSPMEILIYEGMERIKNRTISAIVNGFSQINRAVKVIIKTNPVAIMDSMNSVISDVSFIRQKDLGINRSMLDYYAITMMSMLSFMSIMLGTMCFLGERQFKTIRRLKIAPINQVKLFLAKVLGLLPQAILQITILMIVSVFVFGAKYSSNLLDNMYLFFMFLAVTFTVILIGARRYQVPKLAVPGTKTGGTRYQNWRYLVHRGDRMIRVLLADDDAIIREGLKMILETQEDLECVGAAINGLEAVEMSRRLRPDVVMLDIRMPIVDGIKAAKEIMDDELSNPLLLTTFDEPELILRALQAGINGYILKNSPAERILSAIRVINAGGSVFQKDVLEFIRSRVSPEGTSSQMFKMLLSPRELEVAGLIAEGLSNKEICEKLCLTNGTVRNHISTIMEKTSLEHRTQIAIHYLKNS